MIGQFRLVFLGPRRGRKVPGRAKVKEKVNVDYSQKSTSTRVFTPQRWSLSKNLKYQVRNSVQGQGEGRYCGEMSHASRLHQPINSNPRRLRHSIQLFIALRIYGPSQSVTHLTTWQWVPRVSLLVVRITLLYTVHQ